MATKKKTTEQQLMISRALLNATDLLQRLKNGETKKVIAELEKLHTAEFRWLVLSEQEILKATSSLMNKTAESESKLNDKVLGIFFPHAVDALERVKVIN